MAPQFIKSARPGKPVTWYVYAYKGGPQIMKHIGQRRPKLDSKAAKKLSDALSMKEAPVQSDKFMSIIRAWRASPEWGNLAESTKRVWRGHVDLIENRWGDVPISVWNDPRMKAKVVDWRNMRSDHPRTADIGITVLTALLKWAMLNGQGISEVASSGIPRLYKGGNRQEIIWLPEDMAAFEVAAARANKLWIYDGLRLAALTGLRRADLVSLTFDQVGEWAIEKTALKTSRSRRRKVIIPLSGSLRDLLDELRGRSRLAGVNTVLVNGQGRAWTEGGFGGSFNAIRNSAGIFHIDDDGKKRTKHLHDVRGTFCTMLLTEFELTDEQAAQIMGWSNEQVSEIRKVYVDGDRLAMAIAKRISAKQKAKHLSIETLSP